MVVEAKNRNAINMIESLVQEDGAVSATCGLLSVGSEPQIRSCAVEPIDFADFIVDMVDGDRWLDSPFLIGLFQNSLSSVERIAARMRIDHAIRLHEWEQEHQEEQEEQSECEQPIDESKFEQLVAGLSGLGFSKRDVQKYTTSVRGRSESLQDLLVEGIRELNRSLS